MKLRCTAHHWGVAAALALLGCSDDASSEFTPPPSTGGSSGESAGGAGSSGAGGSSAGMGGTVAEGGTGGVSGGAGSAGQSGGSAGSGGSGGSEPVVATNFTCTQIIGLMITGEWYNQGFEQGGVDPDKWQLKNQHYGYINVWVDPNSEFWAAPITSPCVAGSDAPDRVIFTAADWEYTTQAQWEEQLEAIIGTLQMKYPAIRRIEFMTMVRCPGNQQCNPNASIEPGANFSAAIQDCQVPDYQDAAIAAVAAKHAGLVGVGPQTESPHCREPPDGAHLAAPDNAAAAAAIAAHYAALP
jgi:hypothetical protein